MSDAWSWPPDDDSSYVDHSREVWDEEVARAEREADAEVEAERW
jgi:hypothetical protein